MSKPQLKPTKLIPALVRYSQRRMTAMLRSLSDLRAQQKGSKADVVQRHQDSSPLSNEDLAIKYLEFCVNELKLKVKLRYLASMQCPRPIIHAFLQ